MIGLVIEAITKTWSTLTASPYAFVKRLFLQQMSRTAAFTSRERNHPGVVALSKISEIDSKETLERFVHDVAEFTERRAVTSP
jgi:hypothetical protein